MSKRKTKKSVNVVPWIVGGVLGLSALAFYAKTRGGDTIPPDQLRTSSSAVTSTAAAADQKVHVVQPHNEGMKVTYTSTEQQTPSGQDPKVYALNEYLHQIPAVDKKAKVLAVDVRDGTANLSMSKEFGLFYGSEDEKLILDGIATTLGGFPDVDRFVMSLDGQRIDSLGHADMTDPTPVMRKSGLSKPIEASAPSRPN